MEGRHDRRGATGGEGLRKGKKARGKDIGENKRSRSGVVAAALRAAVAAAVRRRGETKRDERGTTVATTVACWSRAGGGAKLHRSACHPQLCNLRSFAPATTPSGALPRRLLIPPGSYPHGVLKWNEEDAVARDEVAHSAEGARKQRGVLKLQQLVMAITFLSTLLFFLLPPPLFIFFSLPFTIKI